MKRYLAILLAVFMAFMFLSCEPEPPQMVNITLDIGESAPEVIQMVKGSEYQIPVKTREGRTLEKIVDAEGKTYSAGDKVVINSDVRFTWVWSKAYITIELGIGEPEIVEVEKGSEYTIPVKTREGRTLETIVDTAEKTYTAGDKIVVSNDIKLTWVWEKVKISIDKEMDNPVVEFVEKGSTYTIPNTEREDRVLDHYVDAEGKEYSVGDDIVVDADLNLKCAWKKVTVTVKHKQDGKFIDAKTTTHEVNIKEKYVIPESAWTHEDWYLMSIKNDAGTSLSTPIIFEKDTVLTCEWIANYVVTVKDGDEVHTYKVHRNNSLFTFEKYPEKNGTWPVYATDQDGNKVGLVQAIISKNMTYTVVRSSEPYLVEPDTGVIRSYQGPDADVVTLPEKVADITITGINGFGDQKVKKIIMPDTYKTVGPYAFYEKGLSEIKLSTNLESIGDSAFTNCVNLKSIEFPASLKNIGIHAFENSGLTSVDLSKTKVDKLQYRVLYSSKLESLLLPDGLTTIETQAFDGPSGEKILTVDIPATVVSVESQCFRGSSKNLVLNIISEGQTVIWAPDWKDGFGGTVVYKDNIIVGDFSFKVFKDKSGNYVYKVVSENTDSAEIIIPSTANGMPVIAIADDAFKNRTGLKKVTIPSSIVHIGNNAFSGCTSLDDVVFSEGLKEIGSYAFENAPLENVLELPAGVETIGDYAFSQCTFNYANGLKLNEGLVTIGNYAFQYCRFGSISLPNTLKSIGDYAFKMIIYPEKIVIPEGVETLGSKAFEMSYCNEISFPSTLTVIPSGSNSSCSYLEKVIISEGIKEIEGTAFYECAALTTLDLPKTLEKISGTSVIEGTAIESIVIPEGLTDMHCGAFISETLKSLEFKGTKPPMAIGEPVDLKDKILYVPADSVEAYKTWCPSVGFNPDNVKVKPVTP